MLGGFRSVVGVQDQARPVPSVDADPGVVRKFVDEESTDLGEGIATLQMAENGIHLK